jgi:hypothetical protein
MPHHTMEELQVLQLKLDKKMAAFKMVVPKDDQKQIDVDDDEVEVLETHKVLEQRDPYFNLVLYQKLSARQKDWVWKASNVAPGRRQDTYERDAFVKATQGIVALCFDSSKLFKEQPHAEETAIDIFRNSQLGFLMKIMPSLFGTASLVKAFKYTNQKKANTFKLIKKKPAMVKEEGNQVEGNVCDYLRLNKQACAKVTAGVLPCKHVGCEAYAHPACFSHFKFYKLKIKVDEEDEQEGDEEEDDDKADGDQLCIKHALVKWPMATCVTCKAENKRTVKGT